MSVRAWGMTAAVALACLTSVSTSADAQTLTTVLNNGPSNNRVDLVFIGDGYRETQLDTLYSNHVQAEVDYLFSGAYRNPFPRYKNFFNAHRVSVISQDVGADKPLDDVYVDTALDASYSWGGSVERCLYFDTNKANNAVSAALAGTGIDVDARVGIVNDSKYGGCGGTWAVYAGRNSSATDVAVHELGHSLGILADEYYTAGATYGGGEPSRVNLTTNPKLGKWDRWLDYDDPDTNIGPIGYYEGGGYNEFGLYRPSSNSEMRSLNRPFDAVSREQFITRFYQEVDPLDDWLTSSSPLTDPAELWVDTVDPAIINVEWFVDGNSQGILGESIDPGMLGLDPGTYSLQARAYDAILDHSFTGDSLDWYRKDNTAPLEQFVSWTVTISDIVSGDFNGDGSYTCSDIDALVVEISNQSNAQPFDLTGDGDVNGDDLDAWLVEAGGANLPGGGAFLVGDANLDGNVDGTDFEIWSEHKFTSEAAWCSGDFDADGQIGGRDFLAWNANRFQTSSRTLAVVPEPNGWAFVLLTVLPFLRRSGRFASARS